MEICELSKDEVTHNIYYITSEEKTNISDEDCKKLLSEGISSEKLVSAKFISNESDANATTKIEHNYSTEIWRQKGKALPSDGKATELLLSLRRQMRAEFNDRKTLKAKLWDTVASKMKDKGYNCTGTKCSDKFKNLTKTYMKYKNYLSKLNGSEPRPPPTHFEQLGSILEFKNKIEITKQVKFSSKLPSLSNISRDKIQIPGPSDVSILVNPTEKREEAKTVKAPIPKEVSGKKCGNDDVIEAITKCMENSQKSFEIIKQSLLNSNQYMKEQNEILRTQTKQRERMLNLLEQLLVQK